MVNEADAQQRDEMRCDNCGALTQRGLNFCSECGARLDATADAPPPGSAASSSLPSTTFSSCRTLCWFVVGALLLVILMDVVGVFSNLAEARLVTRIIDGELVTIDELDSNDNRQAAVGTIQFLVFIAAAILFLVWIYRAYKNLGALGASGLEYSPGWAVGGWFVPFLNLWRPYQVTAEIWKASDPDAHVSEPQAWQAAPTSPLVKFWWGLWIVGGIIGGFMLRFAFQEPEDLEALRSRAFTFVAADAIEIPAAILAILVVWHITNRQDEKSRRLQQVTPGLPSSL
jgi:hypothetical protein